MIVVVGIGGGRRAACSSRSCRPYSSCSAGPGSRSITPTRRCVQVLRSFAPVFASRGVVQISAFIDVRFASHIADVGAVALISNAQTIYLLPISLFGMSVSAAELPEMSRDSGAQEAVHERLRTRLTAALARVAYFVVPSAVGFIVLGGAIVALLLEGGRFTRDDSRAHVGHPWRLRAGSRRQLARPALLVDVLRAARHTHAVPIRARAHRRHRAARLRARVSRSARARASRLDGRGGAHGCVGHRGMARVRAPAPRDRPTHRIRRERGLHARSCCGWRAW